MFFTASPPKRILFLRPDTYGDLILFEPVLRLIQDAWPQTEIAVLIRERYLDVAPLLAGDKDVRWLTTTCDPYRQGPRENRPALDGLRGTVVAFAPDMVVAACFEPTWLEWAVASFLPEARQIRLGDNALDPIVHASLEAEFAVDWPALYPEKVHVETDALEWEKNLRLADALLGGETPRCRPVAHVPAPGRQGADKILADAGLETDSFVVCCAAGTANVTIKSWPAERYGETLAWLERERGVRALLLGHESERETLEAVHQSARAGNADPALWLGRAGEMPVVAGLLQSARFYFGNDTGALHLAAALGQPVASVFGGGTWPRFKPTARRSAVVVQPLPCFGCAWNCLFGYAPCVREIPPGTVRRALDWLLASDRNEEMEFTAGDAISATGLALIEGAVATHHRQAGLSRGEGDGSHMRVALTDLLKKLDFSEQDRAVRLMAVERQGTEISRLQGEVDRWLGEAGRLQTALAAAEAERNLRAAELADLRGHFEAAEADRAVRLKVIEAQGAEASRLHAIIHRLSTAAQREMDTATRTSTESDSVR